MTEGIEEPLEVTAAPVAISAKNESITPTEIHKDASVESLDLADNQGASIFETLVPGFLSVTPASPLDLPETLSTKLSLEETIEQEPSPPNSTLSSHMGNDLANGEVPTEGDLPASPTTIGQEDDIQDVNSVTQDEDGYDEDEGPDREIMTIIFGPKGSWFVRWSDGLAAWWV
jgi:hypothetical protein